MGEVRSALSLKALLRTLNIDNQLNLRKMTGSTYVAVYFRASEETTDDICMMEKLRGVYDVKITVSCIITER
jgi:hypothetical protein